MPPNRTQTAPAGGADIAEADVVGFLHRHPDLFNRHPELFETLAPPLNHQGNGVVDFQHAMMERLRAGLQNSTGREAELVAIGRANLASQARVHSAALALIAAPTFQELIETVSTELTMYLDVDVAALCVENAETEAACCGVTGVRLLTVGSVDGLLGPDCLVRLRVVEEGDPELFDGAAGLVKSEALLRLPIGKSAPPALVALGSRDADRFDPGQGTELLSFLADVLGLTIGSWLVRNA